MDLMEKEQSAVFSDKTYQELLVPPAILTIVSILIGPRATGELIGLFLVIFLTGGIISIAGKDKKMTAMKGAIALISAISIIGLATLVLIILIK